MPRQLHTFRVYYSQNEMTEHITFCGIPHCLKHDAVPVHLFQSKLCNLLSGKLKILTKIYYFSDNTALHYKKGKNCISICYHKMILSWMLSSTSLQHHIAKVHLMGLGEQLKGQQERQVCKTLITSR